MMETTRAPRRITFEKEDGVMAGWRWEKPGAPRLLFCHATGFCASAYKRSLGAVAETCDVTALDMRGHGRTQLPADPKRLRSWSIYARDISEYLDAEGGAGWMLAGHSMGAVVATLAAKGRSDLARLRLIEPVVMPAFMRWAARSPIWRRRAMRHPPASLALKRKAEWPDRATMAAVYGRKGLFARFAPGAIEDYLEDGVAETEDGVRLACDTAWEAATFIAQANDFHGSLAAAPCPVEILAAENPGSTVPAAAGRVLARLGARFCRLEGVGHLLAMEDPKLAARFLSTGNP